MSEMERQHSRDHWTLKAMQNFGGGFVKQLAEACRHADANNLQRIKDAFPEYWKQYEDMGKRLEMN